jgi:hypothetical protein
MECPQCGYEGFYVEEGEILDFIPEHYCSCNEDCTENEHACFVENSEIEKDCEDCDGNGYVYSNDENWNDEIQKCDTCNEFSSDKDALKHYEKVTS